MDELQDVDCVIEYIEDLLYKGVQPLIQFKKPRLSSDWENTYIQPGMKAEILQIKYRVKENVYAVYCRLFNYVEYNRQFQKNFFDESPWIDYFVVDADDVDKQLKDLIIMPIKGSASISNVDPDLSLVVGN